MILYGEIKFYPQTRHRDYKFVHFFSVRRLNFVCEKGIQVKILTTIDWSANITLIYHKFFYGDACHIVYFRIASRL